MELWPILRAMRRNKIGAILIAVQIALTLAIVANALTLIEQRMAWSARPTGIDEANIFYISAESVDQPKNLASLQAADLAALRSLNGVVDAYATNSYPLQGGGWSLTVTLAPNQKTPSAMTAYYFGDEHALNTLGLKLIAGRNFTPQEIVVRDADHAPPVAGFIVSQALARKLFPAGDALGKSIFLEDAGVPAPIIGIVERLQGPFIGSTGFLSTFADNSALAPYRPLDDSAEYLVRAQPGRLGGVMKAAEGALTAIDGSRLFHSKSMAEAHRDASHDDRGLVVLLGAVSISLAAVTGFGIIGLTSYWVSQRRRQIGIRRAVGATRMAIVRYFQTENLLIATAGILLGMILAIGLNLWMVSSFEMVRIDAVQIIGGAVALLLLGQLAALWPALRAASIAPALATRSD